MQKRFFLQLFGTSAIALASGGLLGGCSQDAPQFRGVNITGADYARDFALTDHHGQPRRLQDFRGKVVIVFFGYTQCPDVCPTSCRSWSRSNRCWARTATACSAFYFSS